MKETTKINMQRNFETFTAAATSGTAAGVGFDIIWCINASNAKMRTKILASTIVGAVTATGAIVGFKVWKRSDEKLREEEMKTWIKEENEKEVLEEEGES